MDLQIAYYAGLRIGNFPKLFAHVIIEKAGKQHKNQISRISPCIKEKAPCEKYRITGPGRHEIVDQQKYGKKTKYKITLLNTITSILLYHG